MKALRFGVICLAVMALAPCALASGPPDIVVFISDDHSYLDCALAEEGKDFPTPQLARLASQGMTFHRAFAPSPSCAPCRAALLTGLVPIRNGAMLNHQAPRSDVKKFPAYLHELGYHVVAFGKVAHYKQGRDYGFDLVQHDTFHDHQCIAAAVEFLNSWDGRKPLCLCVGTNWPHVPWPNEATIDPAGLRLPPTHVDTRATRRWRARYAAAVQRFDDDLGTICDTARERLGDDTVLIHFSDHGAQWPFGKWNLYDTGIRVPLVVVWPGVTPPGSHSQAMINLIDVLPTIVEMAGGAPPEDIDGRSFVPVLTGRGQTHRDRIFTTHSGDGRMNAYPCRAVRTDRWKYIRNLNPDAQHHTHIDLGKAVDGNHYWSSWLRRAAMDAAAADRVERYHRRPAEELYDLQSDPYEMHNLAASLQHADQLAQLRRELDAWMQDHNDLGLETEKVFRREMKLEP